MDIKLSLKGITKAYGKTAALRGFSYDFTNGIYVLLGENGSGKSTLMNIMALAITRDSGSIQFKNVDIEKCKKEYISKLGFLPQKYGIYTSFTAQEYLRYISILKNVPRKESHEQNRQLLDMMGLYNVRNDKVRTFSGGMIQRLALAQAFVGKPDIILLDEPTNGLDESHRMALRNYLSANGSNKTIVICTHVSSDFDNVAHETIFLDKGRMAERAICELPLYY